MPASPASARARPSRHSVLRPPRPGSGRADGDGGLAAGKQHGGGREGMAVRADAAGDAGQHGADLARLAFQRVAQDQRREAQGARFGGHRLQRHERRGDHAVLAAGEARVAGLGRLLLRLFEMRGDRGGRRDPVMREERARFGEGRGVGHGGAGGDGRRVVAGHVGDGEGDHARRVRRRGEPPALDRRKVAADAVHLADGGAGAEQRAVDLLLVGKRQPRRRQGKQRRAAARDEEQHEVAVGQAAARERQDAPRRRFAGGVGHRVRGFHHLDARASAPRGRSG